MYGDAVKPVIYAHAVTIHFGWFLLSGSRMPSVRKGALGLVPDSLNEKCLVLALVVKNMADFPLMAYTSNGGAAAGHPPES